MRAVWSAGRTSRPCFDRVVLLELGAHRHVLPVQATSQRMRRRPSTPRDHRSAGQMFPDAQGQNQLTGAAGSPR